MRERSRRATGGKNVRERTFAKGDGGVNVREGMFARGDLQGHAQLKWYCLVMSSSFPSVYMCITRISLITGNLFIMHTLGPENCP